MFYFSKIFIFDILGYSSVISGSYYYDTPNSEHNRRDLISLDKKLGEELSIERSPIFGGLLGVGSKGGDFKKKSYVQN